MLSYSLHIGSKNHAIQNGNKLKSVSNHNLRKFKKIFSSESNIDLELSKENVILRGTDNAYQDVRDFYDEYFTESRIEYNLKQVLENRKIYNYFSKIEEDKQKNVAVEMIIQIGDMEHWKDKSIEERKKMSFVFEKQLEKLEEVIPNFKICNAVIHYDESSPHMQLIGVPVANNCKRGMRRQVSQNAVLKREKLVELQEKMRENAIEFYNRSYREKEVLKPKEKGRNYDFTIAEIKEIRELEKEKESFKKEINDLKRDSNTLEKDNERKKEEFQTVQKQLNNTKKELDQKKQETQKMQNSIKQLEQSYSSLKKQYQGAERELDRVQEELEGLESKKYELERDVEKTDRKNKKAIEEYKEMLAVQEYTIRDLAEKTAEKETIEKEIAVHKNELKNVLELRLKKDPGYEKNMEIDRLKTEKKMLEIDIKRYEAIFEWFDTHIEGFKEKREEIRKSLISKPQKKNPWDMEKNKTKGGLGR